MPNGDIEREAFKTLLPLYSLKAAAGYFGNAEAVEPASRVEADGLGKIDERMFVCRAVGRSMEPTIRDGDYIVFRAKPVGTCFGSLTSLRHAGRGGFWTADAFEVLRSTTLSELIIVPDVDSRTFSSAALQSPEPPTAYSNNSPGLPRIHKL